MLKFGECTKGKLLKTNKILVIQTAFIGDVVLATSFIELLKRYDPNSEIHFLLRSGTESILRDNPHIKKIHVWEKRKNKHLNLIKLLFQIRSEKFNYVYNIQRFFSSGLLTAFSGAKIKIGFDKNPLSFLFSKRIAHKIPYELNGRFLHEVERNALLYNKNEIIRPRLYFNAQEEKKIDELTSPIKQFIVLAPKSVWFTKEWPKGKWIELSRILDKSFHLFFIGSKDDSTFIEEIIKNLKNATNLCGKLSLKESACLMIKASRVIANDSAPLHLASSVNAKTTAIFLSTIPEFGYGPLSDDSKVVQLHPRLDCMPCGLHGKKKCPKGHFNCAIKLDVKEVLKTI